MRFPLALTLLGLVLFAHGFFLTRTVITTPSTTSSPFPPAFTRLVLIVVDALRSDFVQSGALKPTGEAYENRIYLPPAGLSLEFVADPPSTTMQRLKGVFTGGLPTFVDIKDDVDSQKVEEDNVFDQFWRKQKKIVFAGDDTWVKLYGHTMERAFPYESFNVKDLDTLDEKVTEKLGVELKEKDWDVLVVHFLGVDHAGHRYGPKHAEMLRKLDQMNRTVNSVVDVLNQQQSSGKTLLVVMGDHGMNEAGNHGGATDEEVSSALYVYSPGMDFSKINTGFVSRASRGRSGRTVDQIDLTPTLAVLFGLPIPFGNLGFIIPELFANPTDAIIAARANVEQIMHYLKTYDAYVGHGVFTKRLDILHIGARKTFKTVKEEFVHLREMAHGAVKEARAVWTTFDLPKMWCGVFCCLVGVGLLLKEIVGSGMRVVFPGLVIAWIGSLLALTSDSYIESEAWVACFFVSTWMCLDLFRGSGGVVNKTSKVRAKMAEFVALVMVRCAVELGQRMRETGHEIKSGDFSWLVSSLLLCVLVHQMTFAGLTSRPLQFLLGAQTICVICFWTMSAFGVPGNFLAQVVYGSFLPGVYFLCTTLDHVLYLGLPILSLILGPLGPIAIACVLFLQQRARERYVDDQFGDSVWFGVSCAFLAVCWYFATGHANVFGSLRITAPYVGFDQFGYYRGMIMLTMDTFASHLICAGIVVSKGGPRASLGFLTVFASRAVTTTCFVFYARRELRVWAVFAPKFVFDVVAFFASTLFVGGFHSVVWWLVSKEKARRKLLSEV